MRHAMQSPQSPDQVHRVNPDDRAVGKEFAENAQRDSILGVVEGGNQNRSVGNIEISVTGGKANALEEQRVWHGQIDYLQSRAILQANAL